KRKPVVGKAGKPCPIKISEATINSQPRKISEHATRYLFKRLAEYLTMTLQLKKTLSSRWQKKEPTLEQLSVLLVHLESLLKMSKTSLAKSKSKTPRQRK